MRIRGSNLFLVALAVSILVLGFVVVRMLSEDEGDTESAGVEDGSPDGRVRGPAAAGGQGASAVDANQERRTAGRERRRFRTEQQRQKLIAAIELARAHRLERRARAMDEQGAAEANGVGELSKETIQDAVQAVIEDVKACYDEQLKLSPELGGKIVVDFTINAEEGVGGVVDSVEVNEESDEPMRRADQLAECIVDTIYTLELPAPEGGGTVDVSYPLFMSPADPDEPSE